jgi:peptidyl-prolyl cis-trans isomerase C
MNFKMQIQRFIRLFLLLLSFAFVPALHAQQAENPGVLGKSATPAAAVNAQTNPVVLTVKDHVMTASEFEQIFSSLPLWQQRQFQASGGRRAFADYLGRLMIMSEAAEREKLDARPDIAALLQWTRTQLLAQAEQQTILSRIRVSEDEVKDFYERNKSQFVQLHLLHISVPFAEAGPDPKRLDSIRQGMEEVRLRAMRGEDFAKLAREYSKDSDAAQGGDLGFLGRGSFGEVIDAAVFRLKPGQISEVLGAPGTMHLFKVLEERPQAFSDAREAIGDMLRNQMLQMAIDNLLRETPSSVNEDYFKSTAPTGPMPITVTLEKNGKPVPGKVTVTTSPPAKEKNQ